MFWVLCFVGGVLVVGFWFGFGFGGMIYFLLVMDMMGFFVVGVGLMMVDIVMILVGCCWCWGVGCWDVGVMVILVGFWLFCGVGFWVFGLRVIGFCWRVLVVVDLICIGFLLVEVVEDEVSDGLVDGLVVVCGLVVLLWEEGGEEEEVGGLVVVEVDVDCGMLGSGWWGDFLLMEVGVVVSDGVIVNL